MGLMNTLWTRISTFIWPNRAANLHYLPILDDGHPFVEHFWSGPRAECWFLETLAVSPEYGGLGHGRALVKWGLERAAEEGVCASVVSAPGKERFYENCGFHLQEGRAGQGEGNPATHIPGGLIFWKLATEPSEAVDQKLS